MCKFGKIGLDYEQGEIRGDCMEYGKTYIQEKKDNRVDDQLYKSYYFFFHNSKTPLMVVNGFLEIIQINNQARQLFEEIGRDTYKESITTILEQVPRVVLNT